MIDDDTTTPAGEHAGGRGASLRSLLRPNRRVAAVAGIVAAVTAMVAFAARPNRVELDSLPLDPSTSASSSADPTTADPDPTPTPPVDRSHLLAKPADEQEGMISLISRVCGDARNWRGNAAANRITPPDYWVGTEQTLTVNCLLPADPPVVAAAAPKAAQPAAPPAAAPVVASAAGWVNPVPGACLGSGFGWRSGRIHNGQDLPTPVGTPVHAAHAGIAHWGDDPGGAGWYVIIDHGGGVWTTYFHLSARLAPNGGHVDTGQVIGKSGGAPGAPGAGNSQGPHLHFEVHPWGEWVKQYNQQLGAYAYTNPVVWMANHGVRLGC